MTGVQTCALPILCVATLGLPWLLMLFRPHRGGGDRPKPPDLVDMAASNGHARVAGADSPEGIKATANGNGVLPDADQPTSNGMPKPHGDEAAIAKDHRSVTG